MSQPSSDLSFLEEPRDKRLVFCEVREDSFQSDSTFEPTEALLVGEEHFGHTTASETPLETVTTEWNIERHKPIIPSGLLIQQKQSLFERAMKFVFVSRGTAGKLGPSIRSEGS
jgi:hypothetical protein